MEKIEIDKQFIEESVSVLLHMLATLVSMRFQNKNIGTEVVHARNVILNLIANFIMDFTNHEKPGAIERNMEECTTDLQKMFKIMRDVAASKKGKH